MPPTDELQICRDYAVRIHDATVQAGGATVLDPDVTARIVEEARRDAVEGRWVSRDMPPRNGSHRKGILVAYCDGSIGTRTHGALGTWSDVFAHDRTITRWMALPDAPAKAKVQG